MMQTDTPMQDGTTMIAGDRRAIIVAIRAVDACWLTSPVALIPGGCHNALLATLVDYAARVPEAGAAGHMLRVGLIAEKIARAAGWDAHAALELRLHGALHDIGKLGVPASILNKPGPLTHREMEVIRTHSELGYALLSTARAPFLQRAARVALEHHERWDGTGYPRRLAGLDIDPSARVIALADVYDALTSDRPYRGSMSSDEAVACMSPMRGTHFEPSLFDAFIAAWSQCNRSAPCSPST